MPYMWMTQVPQQHRHTKQVLLPVMHAGPLAHAARPISVKNVQMTNAEHGPASASGWPAACVYPSSAAPAQHGVCRCVAMLADLFHAPGKGIENACGTATIGSSEVGACLG